jgi:hypothetical protein
MRGSDGGSAANSLEAVAERLAMAPRTERVVAARQAEGHQGRGEGLASDPVRTCRSSSNKVRRGLTGEELTAWLEKWELSKNRLAPYLRFTRFHLANLEAGRRRITETTAARIQELEHRLEADSELLG